MTKNCLIEARCSKCNSRVLPKLLPTEKGDLICYYCKKCGAPAIVRMKRTRK